MDKTIDKMSDRTDNQFIRRPTLGISQLFNHAGNRIASLRTETAPDLIDHEGKVYECKGVSDGVAFYYPHSVKL